MSDITSGYVLRGVLEPLSLRASQDSEIAARRIRRRALGPTKLTYAALIEREEQRTAYEDSSKQTLTNRKTALRAFLAFVRLEETDVVGQEMRADFDKRLEAFRKALGEEGRTKAVLVTYTSAVRHWRKAVLEWDCEFAASTDSVQPFTAALRSALGELPIRRVADQAGVPADALYGWMKGKMPKRRNLLPSIHRLEYFFGLKRGALVDLLRVQTPVMQQQVGEAQPVPYRERLRRTTFDTYSLHPAPGSPLREQWAAFMDYKTAVRPSRLKRTQRGQWAIATRNLKPSRSNQWWRFLRGQEVPTAHVAWSQVSAYLGWLRLAPERGGAGLAEEDVQTLAWLAVPDYMERYVKWRQERADGDISGFLFTYFALVASLTRVDEGYLRQQEKFQATLPEAYQTQPWDDLCHSAFELSNDLRRHYGKERVVSRDPFAPIQHILDLDRPLDAVVDMFARMKADRPAEGGKLEAIWSRDIALLKLLISNPLRRKNIAQLSWKADNTGELYQRADGSWWIRIESKHFKNARGAAREQRYDSPIQQMAWKDLERYLKEFRPMLMTGPTDYVFLASPKGEPKPHQPWEELSARVFIATKRYLWRCPGIGPHAFRHLVATALLKASKNDFKTAALLLNDRMSTVEKFYGRVTYGDAAAKMAEVLKESLERM